MKAALNYFSCKLKQFNLTNQRVLLRADLNVPLINSTIQDDFRLRALLPTLTYLQQHNAITFIITHLGRPKGSVDPKLSTKIFVPWFEKNNLNVIFENDLKKIQTTQYKPGTVILFENIRFFPGEQNHDQQFAQEVAACADYYVNDAFGALHRNDTSVTLLANCFAPDKKTIGFLVEKELQELTKLKQNPEQPFLLIIGGGKVDTKLALIEGMLNNTSAIMLCPATVFTFLKCIGKEVGKSLVDEASYTVAQKIMNEANKKDCALLFPVDYQIAQEKIDGPLQTVSASAFPANGIGISLGPKTLELWAPLIKQAKTIFVNAAMGFAQRPDTLEGLHELLKLVAASSAHSVVGGGDSVAAVEKFGLTNNKISFLSTGGGATLSYLSDNPLPGLECLSE